MDDALAIYRREFNPSAAWPKPYVMLALNVVAAADDALARYLFTTQQQAFVTLRRGQPGLVPPPIDDIEAFWTPIEKRGVEHALACAAVGSPATVQRAIADFVARHQPDELMLTANIYDHAARRESVAQAAAACQQVPAPAG
jgi:alkanesulfonate monooxygenase SsuD/methylene tetrahydromethanopterin reductase-like flavin-dependent oxidoreductase (luciferase family)